MDKKGSLEESVVVWDVLIELNIASSDSDHDLVTSALNDLLLGSDQVNLTLDMKDRDGQI